MFKTNATFAERLGVIIKPPVIKKTSKYRNRRVTVDGFNFPSVVEADFYKKLCNDRKEGVVSFFLMQVRIPLNLTGFPKKCYVLDFLVFYPDGRYEFIEIKGKETEKFKLQKAMFEEVYKTKLTVLRRGDF